VALRSLRIPGQFHFTWNNQAVTLLRSKDGEVAQDVQRRAYAVQKRMKRSAPKRRGTLRRGIRVESVRESPIGPYSTVISTAPHTNLAELGRGPVEAWGAGLGAGTEITIDNETVRLASVLRFQYRLGERFSYAPRVKGYKGSHFMENSVDAALD